MADYPYTAHLLDSRQELESGIDDDFSQPGIQHSRIFHSRQYYRFKVIHSLTLAQFNSLLATYAAGPRDEYTFQYHSTSPQTTYTVKFLAPPEIVENIGLSRFFVESNLRGYRN